MPKLSVNLLTHNGAKYIPYLLQSLHKQTFLDWKLRILDNASTDDTVKIMEKELKSFPIQYEVIKNEKNIGFAGGHNVLLKKTAEEYVLLINQDMYLWSDCLEKLVNFLESHQNVAAVSPRLMKWNFANAQSVSNLNLENKNVFTDNVDAIGLQLFRSRRVLEGYGGKIWPEIIKSFAGKSVEVFGVSGTSPMFRKNTLQQIAFADGTVFDELYWMYKEDVDLAFRLTSAGYKSFVDLEAVAFHDRSSAGPVDTSAVSTIENKKKQAKLINYYSYKNQFITIYKNDYWQNTMLDIFPILWYEFCKFGWYLINDRDVFKGLLEIWRQKKQIAKKRKEIKSKQVKNWQEIRNCMLNNAK